MYWSSENAHLHKLGDYAVAICRTPDLSILIFSLPECQLLHQTKFAFPGSIERPLEEDELDQRLLMRENTMMFMFHHPQFFFDEDDNIIQQPNPNAANQNNVKRYARLVFVDFTEFLMLQAKQKTASTNQLFHKNCTIQRCIYNASQQCLKLQSNSATSHETVGNNAPMISMSMDPKFDCNDDYIEKLSVISKDRMVCVLSSGKIILRDIVRSKNWSPYICSHRDMLSIPCPQGLKLPDGGSSSNSSDGYDSDDEGTLPKIYVFIDYTNLPEVWYNISMLGCLMV